MTEKQKQYVGANLSLDKPSLRFPNHFFFHKRAVKCSVTYVYRKNIRLAFIPNTEPVTVRIVIHT